MRVKVDPNPRGSATTHVTMPAANPFEREELSVRSANQPRQMMPGMGQFDFDFNAGTTTGADALPAAQSAPADTGSSWWGGLLQNISSAAINVGQSAAISHLSKPEDQSIQTDPTQALMAAAVANMNRPTAQQLPAVNPNVVIQQPPSQMGKYMPLIIGGVAVAGILGFMMMKGGGGRRRRR
jgi:hypothetical protein